ncbi:hypothetical protein EIP91_010103 [Steccherinum ochraceum]|uniref:F-box domain-containing protein n=1 Tax=Steccherinum ochraceum TaxID=92696 RepID=A0A4V2MXT6_9APHY|nr:hypothetical protein EIP91_010103 [Steccherinum ochraceum]
MKTVPHLQEVSISKIRGTEKKHEKYRWTVAHVCRSWRKVAFQTAHLWSAIRTTHFATIDRVLPLSRRAPLDVRYWITVAEEDEFLQPTPDDLLKAFPRIKCLELAIPASAYRRVVEDVPAVAPLLTSITLVNKAADDVSTWPRFLPTAFDHCSMPSLKRVALFGYRITRYSRSLFPSWLTHLHIQSWWQRPVQLPFVETIEAILSMPHLESLTLAECFLAPVPAAEPRVTSFLASLQYLRVSAPALSCAHFMAHFSFPANATLWLAFMEDLTAPFPLQIAPIFRTVRSAGQSKSECSNSGFRSAALHFELKDGSDPDSPTKCVTMHLWPHAYSRHKMASYVANGCVTSPGSLTFRVEYLDAWRPAMGRLLSTLFADLPLGDVRSLSVHPVTFHFFPPAGYTLLHSLQNLVELNAYSPVGLPRILMCSTAHPHSLYKHGYLLPKLKVLRVFHHPNEPVKIATQLSRRDVYIALMLVLHTRHIAGLALDALSLGEMHTVLGRHPSPTKAHWLRIIEALPKLDPKQDKHLFVLSRTDMCLPLKALLEVYPWYDRTSSFPFYWPAAGVSAVP